MLIHIVIMLAWIGEGGGEDSLYCNRGEIARERLVSTVLENGKQNLGVSLQGSGNVTAIV